MRGTEKGREENFSVNMQFLDLFSGPSLLNLLSLFLSYVEHLTCFEKKFHFACSLGGAWENC
jgi:hypothetical protein